MTNARRVRTYTPAVLWDMGDGVAGLEIVTEYGVCNADLVECLGALPETIASGFRALVLYGADSRLFSAGASLDPFLASIESKDWSIVERFLADGQAALQGLKYASFPVVAAVHRAALSGGCELVLHADALVVEAGAVFGFRERWSGIIPGWGGGTQLMLRLQRSLGSAESFARMYEAFARADLRRAPGPARTAGFLLERNDIVCGREGLLQAAHQRAGQLAETYQAPEPSVLQLPDAEAVREAADAVVAEIDAAERLSDAEHAACAAMLELFTSEPASVAEATQMRRERDTFVALLRNGVGIDERMKAILRNAGQRPATGE